MSERRNTAGAIEVRAEGSMTIAGHASVFDEPYELWGFREQVARGAFKKAIKEGAVAALFNHDPSMVIGRRSAGTLRLVEDEVGLAYEVDLPDTQLGRDLFTLIGRGDITQSSFAFEVVKETWDYPKDEESRELPLRTIKEVRLYDVSPVTYPANPSTDVDVKRAVRGLAEALGIDSDADTVPDLLAQAREQREDTSTEPDAEPGDHSDATPDPGPARAYIITGS